MVKRLEKIAKTLGYEPGEFQIQRLRENIEELKVWKSYIDVGKPPPGFFGDFHTAQNLYRKLAAGVAQEERELLPYFHGRKKHIDQSTKVEGSVTIELVNFAKDKNST